MQDSINEIIDKKIDYIVNQNNIYHSGKVTRLNNFIVEVTGLEDAFYFEKVFIGDESNVGYVDKIEEDKVVISLVKTANNIKVGDVVITTGQALEASFSKDSVGMIIDSFGNDKLSGKKFNNSISIPVETKTIGIMDRRAVNEPLETGIAGIDLMFPIGKGQRQLVIGDKKTGKTQILLDTIVNQKNKDVLCIYVAIGKTKKELKRLYAKLVEKGAHAYTIIVASFNDDLVPLIKLTPYVALSIAEVYMKEGKDVLVCIDDLKKHADACREIALLAEKNTGRDAYPADIFYTHSRLLEKGCKYKNGGSITILPVVETKGGDITDYISTNIISITDGQLVLSEKMFKKGQKPALNFGLSVSRLGGAVQKDSIKKIGSTVRRELLSYLETADVYQLVNVESMSDELRQSLESGKKLLDLLKQPKFSPLNETDLINRFGYINNTPAVDQTTENDSTTNNNQTPPSDNSNNQNNGEEITEVQDQTPVTPAEEVQTEVPLEPVKQENDQTTEVTQQIPIVSTEEVQSDEEESNIFDDPIPPEDNSTNNVEPIETFEMFDIPLNETSTIEPDEFSLDNLEEITPDKTDDESDEEVELPKLTNEQTEETNPEEKPIFVGYNMYEGS